MWFLSVGVWLFLGGALALYRRSFWQETIAYSRVIKVKWLKMKRWRRLPTVRRGEPSLPLDLKGPGEGQQLQDPGLAVAVGSAAQQAWASSGECCHCQRRPDKEGLKICMLWPPALPYASCWLFLAKSQGLSGPFEAVHAGQVPRPRDGQRGVENGPRGTTESYPSRFLLLKLTLKDAFTLFYVAVFYFQSLLYVIASQEHAIIYHFCCWWAFGLCVGFGDHTCRVSTGHAGVLSIVCIRKHSCWEYGAYIVRFSE
jgi:hypothetical protein